MKLTKKNVESLEPTGTRYEVRDDELIGFSIRVGATGEKSFYLTYRAGKGRAAPLKRLRIGTFPSMTVEQARQIVKQKLAQIAMGGDPAQEVKEGKNAPLFHEVIETFLQEHVDAKLKPATQHQYRTLAQNHLIPAFKKMKMADITYRHVAKLHHDLQNTPYLANRCAAVLSKFFDWCEKTGYRDRGTNPVRGLEKYREEKRLKFMESSELEAIGEGIAKLEKQDAIDPTIAAALKVMLLTSARCSEILTLTWEYFNESKEKALLPNSKTGAKVLPIPPTAWEVISALPRVNEYCFPGRWGRGHIINVKDTWKRICKAGGISGWRIHDLRHAFASYAANSGKSLPIIGKILGHSQASTTSRYAHLAENPVAQAAAETAEGLAQELNLGMSKIKQLHTNSS
ncbi:site-specific integrase [Bilophila wadsworthia]|uniref:site-specific integrase n=1 Tax=Bilophila wadsworthia TaxID=35833 RepID=UPI00242D5C23|nr:site-specific integrase [Bilophila wadsworthia]